MRLRVIGVAAVLAVAGCGGGEAEREPAARATGTATATPTAGGDSMPAADWAREVEAICETHRAKLRRAGMKITRDVQRKGGSQEEAIARALERGAQLIEPWLNEIAALSPPQGKEQQAKAFDAVMRETLPLMRSAADAVRDGAREDFDALGDKMTKVAAPLPSLVAELGIPSCDPPDGTGTVA